jgi:FdhD protein
MSLTGRITHGDGDVTGAATAVHPTLAVTTGAFGTVPVTRRELDTLAVEAPLEIRLVRSDPETEAPLAVTMRTPGDDLDLAIGFLFSEGIITGPADIQHVEALGPDTVRVRLAPGLELPADDPRFARRFAVTSACGVCGKSSREALEVFPALPPPPAASPRVDPATVLALPERLRASQPVFGRTGGLHAAGLFDAAGKLLVAREDVGRHNAVDKVVGGLLRAGRLPAHDRLLAVSGRASFELVQKAVLAGLPLLAAVGAPSTAAVDLATAHGLTLLGFVRDGRFNVYAGGQRLGLPHG